MDLPVLSADNRTLAAYNAVSRVPLVGKGIFSRVVRVTAPYFATIPATVESVEPGRGVVTMRHLPWVRNHLGTVHAIALCNLAEMTMGITAEASSPTGYRWIPKGMTVEYLAKARGTMRATATLAFPAEIPDGVEIPAKISITDPEGTEVLTGEIRLWITKGR